MSPESRVSPGSFWGQTLSFPLKTGGGHTRKHDCYSHKVIEQESSRVRSESQLPSVLTTETSGALDGQQWSFPCLNPVLELVFLCPTLTHPIPSLV